MATFTGMRRWEPASEIIECLDTALGTVDLHNECDFAHVVITPDANGVRVSLLFTRNGESHEDRFTVTFFGVHALEVTSQTTEYAEDHAVFHAVDHVDSADRGSTFSIHTELLTLSFGSDRVEFDVVA